jgi:hypothetical protein
MMGTMDSSAFKDSSRSDGSGKQDILFNGPGDGASHGHVVQSSESDDQTEYHYVRDVEGNVYVDNSKK